MQAIRLIATYTIKEDQRDALLAALQENVRASRQEAGNISFEVYEDTTHPHTLYLVEDWQSAKAIEHHRTTPHFATFMERIANLMENRKAKLMTHLPIND